MFILARPQPQPQPFTERGIFDERGDGGTSTNPNQLWEAKHQTRKVKGLSCRETRQACKPRPPIHPWRGFLATPRTREFDGRHKLLGSTQGTRPHQLRQIQILWNDLNVGCFYLVHSPSRKEYFQLLEKVKNPPKELKFISVFFDRELVLKLDCQRKCSLNLLEYFYLENPLFFQKNQHKFVCYPPQLLLDWEANFCQNYN